MPSTKSKTLKFCSFFLSILLMLFAFSSCKEEEAKTTPKEDSKIPPVSESKKPEINKDAKTFRKNQFEVTLTSKFKETEIKGFSAAYESKNMAVFLIKEKFSDLPALSEPTVKEYVKLVSKNNGRDFTLKKVEGLDCFEYDSVVKVNLRDVTYHYFATILKGEDAFYFVQFATEKKNFNKYRDDVLTYAKSIKIDENN